MSNWEKAVIAFVFLPLVVMCYAMAIDCVRMALR